MSACESNWHAVEATEVRKKHAYRRAYVKLHMPLHGDQDYEAMACEMLKLQLYSDCFTIQQVMALIRGHVIQIEEERAAEVGLAAYVADIEKQRAEALQRVEHGLAPHRVTVI